MSLTRDRFYSATFGDYTYAAYAATDPWITRREDNPIGHGAPLGDALTLERYAEPPIVSGASEWNGPGYYLCKYGNQIELALPGLSEREAIQLAAAFGIEVGYTLRPDLEPLPDMWASEAGKGLLAWSATHPRLSARYARGSNYLRGWPRQLQAATA